MFLFRSAYARGNDLKLARGAYTIVLTFEADFPLSSVNQVLVRGCRLLRVACGGCFTFMFDRCVYLEEMLKSLQPDCNLGAKVLELLCLGYADLSKN